METYNINLMELNPHPIDVTCTEKDVFEFALALDNQNILELGCGEAALTRLIATSGLGRTITAAEPDPVQHQKNLLIKDLPQVNFIQASAENIPLNRHSFDTVFMFKSFHHVPEPQMAKALKEIHRVLKPNGIAYISEPLFDGDFNQVLQLFHNEEKVRKAAFNALKNAISNNLFNLVTELFFNAPLTFKNFEQFVEKFIFPNHSQHQLSNELFNKVEDRFNYFYDSNGGEFTLPTRVDILQKKLDYPVDLSFIS